MIFTDEDALICDFAETYGVINFRSLPPMTAATLAQGLPESARIIKKVSKGAHPRHIILLTLIADELRHIVWMLSDNGRKGINHPKSLLEELLHGEKEKKNENAGFASGKEFDAAWRQMAGEAKNG